uniref:Putative secreted peptide n=1 Tax=Anopheles braziliensis TaxID=58242 RepID=A0A2M3ZTF3_9DIPT
MITTLNCRFVGYRWFHLAGADGTLLFAVVFATTTTTTNTTHPGIAHCCGASCITTSGERTLAGTGVVVCPYYTISRRTATATHHLHRITEGACSCA